MNIDSFIFLDFFIIFYLLFCILWSQNFNIIPIYNVISLLGLNHEWPMFVQPQLQNPSISCNLHFKDGSSKNYVFSNFDSNSLIHRKYIDSISSLDYLQSAMSDYLINFSNIENIDYVSIEIENIKIDPYNEYWDQMYKEYIEDYD